MTILHLADDPTKKRPQKPMLADWTREFSLSRMQRLTEPLKISGAPTVGTRPAGGLPPLHASKYIQILQIIQYTTDVPRCRGLPPPVIWQAGAKGSAPGDRRGSALAPCSFKRIAAEQSDV